MTRGDTWAGTPSLTTHTNEEDIFPALDRFNVYRCPTRQGLLWHWGSDSGHASQPVRCSRPPDTGHQDHP
ncbi:hypothetical protein TNCV_5083591 [Trichonephila clavipes]|nr:hypothetical protein TNCV_5083591 [Trichonephila clavipes]